MRTLIVDASSKKWWEIWRPDPWFQAAGIAADALNTFEHVIYAKTTADVYAALVKHEPAEVHVWGHGSPGAPSIGRLALDPEHASWRSYNARGVRVVWFRSCYVAQGSRGISFCTALAAQGCSVVAHLSLIGALGHSWCVGVRAYRRPWWSPRLEPKPAMTRWVSPLANEVPSWAFRETL